MRSSSASLPAGINQQGATPPRGACGHGHSPWDNYHSSWGHKTSDLGGGRSLPRPHTVLWHGGVRSKPGTHRRGEGCATRRPGTTRRRFRGHSGGSEGSCPYPHGPDHGPAGLEMTTLHRTLHPGRKGPPRLATILELDGRCPQRSAPVSDGPEPIGRRDRRAPGLWRGPVSAERIGAGDFRPSGGVLRASDGPPSLPPLDELAEPSRGSCRASGRLLGRILGGGGGSSSDRRPRGRRPRRRSRPRPRRPTCTRPGDPSRGRPRGPRGSRPIAGSGPSLVSVGVDRHPRRPCRALQSRQDQPDHPTELIATLAHCR